MYETHIGIPLLTKRHVKPKSSSVADHLLLYNHSTSYDDFSILTLENKMFLLEFKKSLLIMKDKPSPKRNIHLQHVPIRQSLVIRLVGTILFVSIVATLFLLNGLFLLFSHM